MMAKLLVEFLAAITPVFNVTFQCIFYLYSNWVWQLCKTLIEQTVIQTAAFLVRMLMRDILRVTMTHRFTHRSGCIDWCSCRDCDWAVLQFFSLFLVSTKKVARARSGGRPRCIEEVGQKAWETAGETNQCRPALPLFWLPPVDGGWIHPGVFWDLFCSVFNPGPSHVLQKSGQGCGLNITGVKVWLHTFVCSELLNYFFV